MEKDRMNAQLEALKMAKEWSAWLITIQIAICTFLWNVLNQHLAVSEKGFAGVILHGAWLSFVISVVIATLLISRLPMLIEELTETKTPKERIFEHSLKIWRFNPKLKNLFTAQHLFFLLGVLFLIIFIIIVRPIFK